LSRRKESCRAALLTVPVVSARRGLLEEQALNETAACKIIGLTLETCPRHVHDMSTTCPRHAP